jgi:hypothetical protein
MDSLVWKAQVLAPLRCSRGVSRRLVVTVTRSSSPTLRFSVVMLEERVQLVRTTRLVFTLIVVVSL